MALIDRTKAKSLIPIEISNEIIKGMRKQSVAMQLMRRLPNMSTDTQKQPVLSMLPIADFVDGDAGLKVTTEAAWKDKQIVIGEIAAIMPIPDAVIADSKYNLWGELQPLLIESFGRVFDKQVYNGGNPKAPSDWPAGIIPMATTAGNIVTAGTGTDVAEDINQLMGVLEEQEYDVNGIAAQKSLRTQLRGLRDSNNQFIYAGATDPLPAKIYETPTYFVGAGTWDKTKAIAIAGQWENAVYSIRQDMTFEIFDSGVISDETGKVVYNLMQQDMSAIRAVMRLGWQVANPIDIDRQDIDNTFPFALLTP